MLNDFLSTSARPQPAPTPSKKISVFDNEEEFASTIEERATQKATEISARMIQTQKAFDTEVAKATSAYPELNDPSTNAYTLVKQQLESQDSSLRGTPQGFRMAVLEAAAEEGLVPSSKRKKADSGSSDDFSISSSSSGSQGNRARSSKSSEPNELETQFAQLIGAPLDNPKFQELFKQEVRKRK